MRHFHTAVVSSLIVPSVLLSGAATQSCNSSNYGDVGPSKGKVIGAAVGVGAVIAIATVVLVEVHNSHHTLKGCVTTSPNGLQVISDFDGKVYQVSGVTANVKVGDQVRLHGAKEKSKGSSNRTFIIQEIKKDYGPCKAPVSASAATQAPKTP